MRMFLYGVIATGLWSAVTAQEVYRCEDPEQGIVFQQTPCPEPEVVEQEKAVEAETREEAAPVPTRQRRPVVGRNQSVEEIVAAQQEEQRHSAAVEACKQQYRDAIDAIDLEIQNSYTPEQREYYLGRLKALTDKMSAC
ncbi:MAG: hypothetical protein GTO71_05750 [Woeseiaceae bacterium]|nr:hypothetical protein [Woeseiaceae bacterium]NIP20602.1 hypothetical protein [Woeseiaceae bacterium]NIS89395.1 hypothetical protein [Woeseiaceae bacterium]